MSMSEKELSLVLWIGGFMLTAIGSLIVLSWGSIVYIFTKYREDNDCEHDDFKMMQEKHDDKIHEISEDLCKLLGEHESCIRGKK